MATSGTHVRRGLPRTPGGEPWPPAAEALQASPAEIHADPAPDEVAAVAPAAPLVLPLEAARTAEVPPLSGEMSVPSTDAAASVALRRQARPIRRGLPRVAGGEPWPTATDPVEPAAPRAADAEVDPASAASDAAPAGPGSARPAPAVPDASAAAAPTAPAAAPTAPTTPAAPAASAASGGVALRRGLPRVAGGELWPPAGTAPEPGSAPRTGAAGSAAAAAAAETPEAPAAAHSTVLLPAGAADPVVAGPRPPLPFTRTVWAGRAAEAAPIPRPAPERIRGLTRAQWAGAVIGGGVALLFAAAMLVFAARWFVSLPGVQSFLVAYPGETHLPEGAPVGFPAWLAWQHFFNTFFIVLIIRTGWQVRTEKRPGVFWTPRWSKKGRGKISLALWFHQSLDVLWLANGLIFIVLLCATGQWMRVVPTSWDALPNALSAALQYVSLDWPTENGWVNYNSLQVLAYFVTIFVAAPLAVVTGVRMSGFWPKKAERLNKAYPIEWARAVHFPVMLYFVAFIVVHVALVFATGALRNLNHMYGGQDAVNWTGFWIFVGSMALLVAGWIAARPMVLAPIARLSGKVSGR